MNAAANQNTIIWDEVAGVSVSNTGGRFVRWYTSPIHSVGFDNSQICGIQSARYGGTTASATTMNINPLNANFWEITGTNVIQTITGNTAYCGQALTLMFSNASPGGVSNAGNIFPWRGNSATWAKWDTIHLTCNGNSWFEAGHAR